MRLGYWVRNPRLLLARIRYWWWERRNPDKPWLTPGAVAFLESRLTPDMNALEFGSGRSTLWYATKVDRLLSIEHNEGWFVRVKAVLVGHDSSNVDYRFIPLDHPECALEQPTYSPLPAYVAVVANCPDKSLDFVVVDGLHLAC